MATTVIPYAVGPAAEPPAPAAEPIVNVDGDDAAALATPVPCSLPPCTVIPEKGFFADVFPASFELPSLGDPVPFVAPALVPLPEATLPDTPSVLFPTPAALFGKSSVVTPGTAPEALKLGSGMIAKRPRASAAGRVSPCRAGAGSGDIDSKF